MSIRIVPLILLALITSACQPNIYPDNVDQGSICYEPPYPADGVGLVADERGWVLFQLGLDVRDAPRGEIVARLDPGDSFTVLDGPGCWQTPRTSNTRTDHRVWRIQTDSQGIVGWVHEYGWSLVSGITRFVEPLTDEQTQRIGQPLDAPLTFSGELQWTSVGGPLEPRLETHRVTFDQYGYINVAITADDPGLVNPDVFADANACRVVVLISPTVPLVSLIGKRVSAGSKVLEHLWVAPGDYAFEVSLRFMPGVVEGAAPECQDTAYVLTISPV